MTTPDEDPIRAKLDDDELIERVLRAGVREALIRHKLLGAPIVVWEDGKTVWIPPEEIVIPEPEEP